MNKKTKVWKDIRKLLRIVSCLSRMNWNLGKMVRIGIFPFIVLCIVYVFSKENIFAIYL